ARPVLTNTRLAVEVFDGTGHFGMWKSEVLDALFQQDLDIAIEESKPKDVEERNWLTINRLACGEKGGNVVHVDKVDNSTPNVDIGLLRAKVEETCSKIGKNKEGDLADRERE
ncbi:hypothetical protein Tco_0298700, partial [Tanacetum coccineum]